MTKNPSPSLPANPALVPVILSGGSGSRLWPVSREASPKPFMTLGGGASLLQRTLLRALPLADANRALIVTNNEYFFRTKEEIDALPLPEQFNVTQLLEPSGRNTAPAIAAAALWAVDTLGDALMLVLPADHLISDEDAFRDSVRQAMQTAADGSLVLFGIQPTSPETGFGYLEAGKPQAGSPIRDVDRFVEKPSLDKAMQFLSSGNYYWNSGMFCFKASAVLEAMKQHCPEVLQAVQSTWKATAARDHAERVTLDAASFAQCPDISIDYAVMEHATAVRMMPSSFGWSDIGSWRAVAEQLEPDSHGNTTVGETLMVDTRDTHVQSVEGRLVATVGVEGLLVVDTPDALLVASKAASQQVKKIVEQLKDRGHEAALNHRTVARPWGTYTVLLEGPRFKIKRIEVKPKQQLSLQMHHHRSEHWIVVSGTAKVVCGDTTTLLSSNESTYIPIGTRHRLENPGKIPLSIIEVQCGDYLGEDDIVRFNDTYGRVTSSA